MAWLAFLLAVSVVAAAPAPADELAQAYVAGDADALAEAVGHKSTADLDRRLHDKRRLVRLSTIAALTGVDDPWAQLTGLADAAGAADRPVAVAASRVARTIARRLNPGVLEDRDVNRAAVAAALERFRKLVADQGRWADVRVLALETGTLLGRSLGDDTTPAFLTNQIKSDEPEVRRAALELLPQPLTKSSRAAAAAAVADKDDLVAATAAAVMCQGISAGDPAAPVRAALGEGGSARVTAFLKAPPPGLEPAMIRYLRSCAKAAGKTK